jgi:cytochrome c553
MRDPAYTGGMGNRWLGRVGVVVAVACGAGLLAGAAATIEVSPESMRGRTEAAVAEFRAAVKLEPRPTHGAALFITCATCHRADGSGSVDGTIPVIAGQHVSVVVKQLVDFRHDRRWNERMQNASKVHELKTAQDLLDVAAYAESLKRPAPRPATVKVQGRDQGQVVYYRECEKCHGRLAQGDLRTVLPRLAGQHYEYLQRQLNDTAAGQRPGMDEAHVNMIGALSADDRAWVAYYLSQLTPELTSQSQ